MGKKVGRPSKKLDDLPGDWETSIIEMMREGASLEEVKAELSISDQVYYRFIKEKEEFTRTIKKGKMLSEAWWLKQGRINLENPKFSPTLWYMNMKNRFGWSDKQEVNYPDIPVSIVIHQEGKSIFLGPPVLDEGEESGDFDREFKDDT